MEVYKFLKTEFHGKCTLKSSRTKFTRLCYLKLILIQLIISFYFDFYLSIKLPHQTITQLLLSTNVLLFDALTIWIQYFVLFFSILSQKKNKKIYVKRKNNIPSSCMIFLVFYMGWTYILRGSLFIQVVPQET